jgi:single-stranded DNA-binding protein
VQGRGGRPVGSMVGKGAILHAVYYFGPISSYPAERKRRDETIATIRQVATHNWSWQEVRVSATAYHELYTWVGLARNIYVRCILHGILDRK